jgi:RNA methyltransferase, RsmD family
MKIVAGIYGGRKIKTISGDVTRPTSEKIRAAIFDALGQFFDGGNVLDLFSGSGAMAIEAVSRGYEQAICVDINRAATAVIRQNIQLLAAEEHFSIYTTSYQRALGKLSAMKFDLIIIDPPYKMKVLAEILQDIYDSNLLNSTGKIVLECSNKVYPDIDKKEFANYQVIFNRRYDTTQILMLQLID